jgi:hypothetical protein
MGMPSAFNPEQAQGVEAVIQLKVNGSENFEAYLSIADG